MSGTTNIPDDNSFDPILAALPAGVQTITAEYSGSGDSGQFDTINFLDLAGKPVPLDGEGAIAKALEDRFDDLLEQRHPGWEIHDGASGTFTLHVRTRKLDHQHRDYYTAFETTNHQSEV